MYKNYLKKVVDLTDSRRQGNRKKIIQVTINFINGESTRRFDLRKVDDVHEDIIAVINFKLKGSELLKVIDNIEYKNHSNKKTVLFDVNNLTINGEKIPPKQLKLNEHYSLFAPDTPKEIFPIHWSKETIMSKGEIKANV